MNASARVALAAVCFVIAGSGCAARRPEPVPAPVPIAAEDPLLRALVEGWRAVLDQRASLRAGAVLKLEGPGGDQRLSQNVVVARPARLRMEFQSFLVTAAVLVADGTRYDYFQSVDRYRENGPVHPGLLWDIAGVPLTLDQAVQFLLGGPPPRPGLAPAGGERASDGTVRVDLDDPLGRRIRSLWFDGEGRLTRALEWTAGGELRWQVGYDHYRDVGAQPFAHRIDFEFPRYSSRATVAFRSVELNPETPDAVFELQLQDEAP